MTPRRSPLFWLGLLGWLASMTQLASPSLACDGGSETPPKAKAKGK